MYKFENIVGNKQIIKSMKNALENGKISHAYILNGAYGCGKMLMAETFTTYLECQKGVGKSCGSCSACKTVESHNNPDVFYVVSKNKTIGVDDIREQVIKQVEIKQYKYRYKVFIIEDADKMTVAAQNVLLKTLEEPPKNVIFLLLTQKAEILLPTVLSRCVLFKIRPIKDEEVENYLVNNLGKNFDEAYFFAKYSAGSIGKAKKLIEDEDFVDMRTYVIDKLYNIGNTGSAEVIEWAKDIEKYKERIWDFLDIAYLWFRDVLVAKKTGNVHCIIQKDNEDKVFLQAKNMSFLQINNSLDAIWQAKRQLEQNGNFRLTIEIMLINIKGV